MTIRGGRTLRRPTCWLRWRRAWVTIAGCTTVACGSPDTTPHAPLAIALYEKAPPALPPAAGRVVRVATPAALRGAVSAMQSGTTVLIAPGRYRITAPLAIGNVQDVAIRGESGRAEDTVIEGPGLDSPPGNTLLDGIWTGNVRRLVLADFTIRDLPRHCVILNAGTTDPLVHHVHFIDCGQQNIKANPDATGVGVRGAIVEYSRFEYTTTSRGAYTNAISGIGAIGWVVRHNVFRNIRAPRGQMAGPVLLFRGGARDTLVDSNTFLECQRGVSFGMLHEVPADHSGGVIRNNFFYRSPDRDGDTAFSLWNTPGTRVVHNTVLVSGTYHAAIDYRWEETAGVIIANNLLDAPIWQRSDVPATTAGNVFGARPSLFRNAAAGDLHLVAPAGAGADGYVAGAEVDWDGDPRPRTHPAAGADEMVAGVVPGPR